ncbi:MAG: AAA family ATPase [Bdellovibrionales bacterium]|nr:AAA family ATPase [Bdellovibrionales bacterium]
MSALSEALLRPRILLVTGKGGVGRSAAAAGWARVLAARGIPVLLTEAPPEDGKEADGHPPSALARLFGRDRLPSEVEQWTPGLSLRALSARRGQERFLGRALHTETLARAALGSEAIGRLLDAAPSLRELGIFHDLHLLLKDLDPRTRVIIDMPATGHALAATSVPRLLRRLIPAGPLHESLGHLESRLKDPDFAGALVVTLPEELPVTEGLELAGALRESGVKVAAFAMNRALELGLPPEESDALWARLSARPAPGRETLRRARESHRAREILAREAGAPVAELGESILPGDEAVLNHLMAEWERAGWGEGEGAPAPSWAPSPAQPLAPVAAIDAEAERLARAQLRGLAATRTIIVCCGAGGVGKTTTSAALAIAAARAGRRVLALTIDPSKRLAQCLGVERNPKAPVTLRDDRARAFGITGAGRLDAWMLDPRQVADDAVARIVQDPEAREAILRNSVYRHATALVSGMQEYTAMEALHSFLKDGRYDLVILDTPPSRHALDFLEAPSRLSAFLDGRIFRLFLPKEGGFVQRAASTLVQQVLTAVFGREFATDLVGFLGSAARLLRSLKGDVLGARESLASPDAAFLVVSSPAPAALEEAHYLQGRLAAMGLPLQGMILNRSLARLAGVAPETSGPLAPWAVREAAEASRHAEILAGLRSTGGGAWALALPPASRPEDEGGTLAELADDLLG